MDWPLPLWQMLGEELDQLRPPTADIVADTKLDEKQPGAEASPYEYRPPDTIDPTLLSRHLELRLPELQSLIAKTPGTRSFNFGEVAAAALASLATTQPDARFLNGLLRMADLYAAFPALAESRWIADQKPEQLPEDKVIALNRFLLDRALAGAVQPIDETMLSGVVDRLHQSELSALCFSGGGIRSATFCLGVVQGLARKGLLDRFDYLSTVSGGGYLGSWLAAWTYWNKDGLPDVISQLATAKTDGGAPHFKKTPDGHAEQPKTEPSGTQPPKHEPHDAQQSRPAPGAKQPARPAILKLEPEPDPVFYLRNFSNYLTPRTGLFSTDTWTLIGIFLRNLLLHWSVILPPLIAILLMPDLLFALMRNQWLWDSHEFHGYSINARYGCFVLAVITMAIAVFYEGLARPSHLELLRERSRWWLARRAQSSFLLYFLAPLTLSSFLFATYLFHAPDSGPGPFILYGSIAGVLGWSLNALLLGAKLFSKRIAILWSLLAVALSGVAGGAMLYRVVTSNWLVGGREFPTLYFCLMPPITLIVFLLAATIFIGLVTLFTSDEDREYWARMGAWALIATLGWSAFGAVSLFGPLLLLHRVMIPWSVGAGVVSSALTTYLGWSSKTGARTEARAGTSSSSLLQRSLPILGAIAIALILCALSLAGLWLVQHLSSAVIEDIQPWINKKFPGDAFSQWKAIAIPDLSWSLRYGAFSGLVVLATLLLTALFGFATSLFIDVNKYSLHAMYRNRLIRAYLGASREKGERQPNPFTGFDPRDNLAMCQLWQKSPRKLMPVINIALNLVAPISDKLAWQERKAESFTVTPLHVGSFRSGYRRANDYASKNILWFQDPKPSDPKLPLTLGTATAISGAAVSPNMGYNSSPIVTMLLSIFNVRLGWWLGNPGGAGNETYMRAQPGFGVKYFADEALGRTSAERPFVHLSDGGHFENLGLYEMVLRRCHTIVVIDADQDLRTTFENLGNAIRKVRIDLGIPIDFPSFPNFAKHNAGGIQTEYCAVGTIKYNHVDPGSPDGRLIYVKPTIIGNEPADVLNYERRCGEFPHESTADQWFSESQFESYRALGMHEIETIAGGMVAEKPASDPYAQASGILKNLPAPIA
ncbi:MAG: patatin-like phospholipase family protein [Candidatus Binatus sp.]|uniref:patatin-like phospholipase family protein n=1 Tax=Candidatus Binatus sp. TaxID=2811406 RepID=UPI0027240842|nr:patatin-like phospholipase family protein [Candidatus Binatus sp.]MDO8432555.1 patatin-like phospholipase family protein [Candidatus Binatus sp.]